MRNPSYFVRRRRDKKVIRALTLRVIVPMPLPEDGRQCSDVSEPLRNRVRKRGKTCEWRRNCEKAAAFFKTAGGSSPEISSPSCQERADKKRTLSRGQRRRKVALMTDQYRQPLSPILSGREERVKRRRHDAMVASRTFAPVYRGRNVKVVDDPSFDDSHRTAEGMRLREIAEARAFRERLDRTPQKGQDFFRSLFK